MLIAPTLIPSARLSLPVFFFRQPCNVSSKIPQESHGWRPRFGHWISKIQKSEILAPLEMRHPRTFFFFPRNISSARLLLLPPPPRPLVVVTLRMQPSGDLWFEGSHPQISSESLAWHRRRRVRSHVRRCLRLAATSSSNSHPEVVGFYKWSCHIPLDTAFVTDRQAVTNCQE